MMLWTRVSKVEGHVAKHCCLHRDSSSEQKEFKLEQVQLRAASEAPSRRVRMLDRKTSEDTALIPELPLRDGCSTVNEEDDESILVNMEIVLKMQREEFIE